MANPDRIEQILLSRPLPCGLPAGERWVAPSYDGLSIANLPATVAALLSAEHPGLQFPGHNPATALPTLARELWKDWLPGLRRVVLVILDALGYRLLQQMQTRGEGSAFANLAAAGSLTPLTSVFPSTTDAALLSLRSGVPPATHGWLAYTIYLREMGIAANAIMLCPVATRQSDLLVDWGLDLDKVIPVPTLAQCLAEAEIATGAVLSHSLLRSSFTKMLYKGVQELRGHFHGSDFWGQLRHLLSETGGRRAFLTAYWSGLDTLGHAYSPETDLWEAEFRTVNHLLEEEFLGRLGPAEREGTLLLITADHGQLRIPPDQILNAGEHPEIAGHLLVPIMGESRAAFIHPRPGRAPLIRAALEDLRPGWFVVLDSAAALDAGLMGLPVTDEAYSRAGELLVLPRGNHALQQFKPPVSLVGRHGGLTEEEMLVPLIGVRLEALP